VPDLGTVVVGLTGGDGCDASCLMPSLCPRIPLSRMRISRPALLPCLSLRRLCAHPVLLDQLQRPRLDSFILVLKRQDQRID